MDFTITRRTRLPGPEQRFQTYGSIEKRLKINAGLFRPPSKAQGKQYRTAHSVMITHRPEASVE